jgi:anti-anti-sigma regulatory factor
MHFMEHSSRLDISLSDINGHLRLSLSGSLTLESSKALTAALDRGIHPAECPDLVLDLQGAEHIEPAGLAALQLYVTQVRQALGLPEPAVEFPVLPLEEVKVLP